MNLLNIFLILVPEPKWFGIKLLLLLVKLSAFLRVSYLDVGWRCTDSILLNSRCASLLQLSGSFGKLNVIISSRTRELIYLNCLESN